VVGLSCVSQNFGHAQSHARRLKEETGCFVLLGGPHITNMPNEFPECFDLGFIGEGEVSLTQVLSKFLEEGLTHKGLESIRGLIFHKEGKLINTGYPDRVEDMDDLPIPNRKKWVRSLGMTHMMTTRGCPYRCFFCDSPYVFKGFRGNSAEYVANEIRQLKSEFPETKYIRFYDDIFVVDRKRLRELVAIFKKDKFFKSIGYSGFVRDKLVDEEMVQNLKDLNFILVQFGADSASPGVLKQLKNSKVEDGQRAIDLFYNAGIPVGCSFVIGSPFETLEDLKRTYQFIKKNRKKIFELEINPAVVLPGTPLWDYAEKKGLLPKEIDWEAFRDPAWLQMFDLNHYIYVAEQIQKKDLKEMVDRFLDLFEEHHDERGTVEFMTDRVVPNYITSCFKSDSLSSQGSFSEMPKRVISSSANPLGKHSTI
jgi:magnesium-protoporphyrin IX monomethyl ester (oxidative) cyclase